MAALQNNQKGTLVMNKYKASIILFTLAFLFGLAAAATYPGPFSLVYSVAGCCLLFAAGISAAATAETRS